MKTVNQQQPTTRKRESRVPNTISPFDRILHCRGIDFIKNVLEDALEKAEYSVQIVSIDNMKCLNSSKLQTLEESLQIPQVICKVKKGDTGSGYPTFKVYIIPSSS